MSKIVKIGHLVGDENGKAGYEGNVKPGDQTGKESKIQEWYDGGWTFVFRAKDKKVREKIAAAMEAICNNPYAGGYNQVHRTTLYFAAKNHNWDISAITKEEACEADCSAGVAVCINAAGIPISKDMYTGNEKELIEKTGKFDTFGSKEYLKGTDKLQRGDILLKVGHTAVVVSAAEAPKTKKVVASKGADKRDTSLKGTYITTSDLNMRDGAGTSHKVLTVIPSGGKVQNYGYYTPVKSGDKVTKWLYVIYEHKNIEYTGFVSMNYLKKSK